MIESEVDVSPERFAEIYDELSEIEVSLDPDPLEFGPDRIGFKFHVLDKHLNRINQMELQLSSDSHKVWKAMTLEKLVVSAKRNELMISDAQVRKEKTKGEREARADMLLSDEIAKLGELETQVNDLERVLLVVKTKKRDLKDTEKRLRDQMKMVSESIRMGMNWGRPSFLGTTNHSTEEKTLDQELDEIMREGQ